MKINKIFISVLTYFILITTVSAQFLIFHGSDDSTKVVFNENQLKPSTLAGDGGKF